MKISRVPSKYLGQIGNSDIMNSPSISSILWGANTGTDVAIGLTTAYVNQLVTIPSSTH